MLSLVAFRQPHQALVSRGELAVNDNHHLPQPRLRHVRNTLAMIRQSGEEPEVIEYLKEPPSRERLVELIAAMDISPRDLLRRQGHAL